MRAGVELDGPSQPSAAAVGPYHDYQGLGRRW